VDFLMITVFEPDGEMIAACSRLYAGSKQLIHHS
jgi:hypothetical protein